MALALDKSLRKNQKLPVNMVLTGDEFKLEGIQSELLCVKLMGSLDRDFNQPGSMVLSLGDLANAKHERSRIFDTLKAHAAHLSFLFVGYSFNDDIFLDTLEEIFTKMGRIPEKSYAIFRDKPDEEKEYLLAQYNIDVIISDLSEFIGLLCNSVAENDPKDHSLKRIPVGRDVIPINSANLRVFLSKYNPTFIEKMAENVTAYSFLLGETSSFKPFENEWHFERQEINLILSNILSFNYENKQACILKVTGGPGTGRTFSIMAAVAKLIRKNRAISIEIPNYAINKIPDLWELKEFINEIFESASSRDIPFPERVVFWSKYTLDQRDILKVASLAKNIDIPICLIYEDARSSKADFSSIEYEIIDIHVDEELSKTKKDELIKYLIKIIRDHSLPESNEKEIEEIINQEKEFLPIVYRCLDPSKRSINRIVEANLLKFKGTNEELCINLCAMATSLDLDVPLSIIQKVLSKEEGMAVSYPEAYSLIENAKDFLVDEMDSRYNIYVRLYNIYAANHIVTLQGQNSMDMALRSIAEVADLKVQIESAFIRHLLIEKGVNWSSDQGLPFSEDGLESAFLEIKRRQPARPIIHHLARF